MIGFSFILEPLPTLGIVHTWTKHERHTNTGVNEGCRAMYLLTNGRAAQWSHYFATACDYNRTGSVVMKKRSQFVQDSLAHQDKLGMKARLNQCWFLTLLCMLWRVVHCLEDVRTGQTAETELAPEKRNSSRLSEATRSQAPSAAPV